MMVLHWYRKPSPKGGGFLFVVHEEMSTVRIRMHNVVWETGITPIGNPNVPDKFGTEP
jgi:hypothetical protein